MKEQGDGIRQRRNGDWPEKQTRCAGRAGFVPPRKNVLLVEIITAGSSSVAIVPGV